MGVQLFRGCPFCLDSFVVALLALPFESLGHCKRCGAAVHPTAGIQSTTLGFAHFALVERGTTKTT